MTNTTQPVNKKNEQLNYKEWLSRHDRGNKRKIE